MSAGERRRHTSFKTSSTRFTVVTINFHQDKYLWEAIDSVRQQTWPNWEHIIVDAGRDGSDEDWAYYHSLLNDSRYKVLLGHDQGPADGLNRGLVAATGDLFAYINADDFFLSRDALRDAARVLSDNPDAAAVVGHGVVVDEQGRPQYRIFSDRFNLRSYALGTCVAVQQATFLRTDAVRDVGGFNVANKTSWDGELLVDLVRCGYRITRTKGVWGAFRIYPSSITGSGAAVASSTRQRRDLFRELYGHEIKRRHRIERGLRRTTRLIFNPRRIGAAIRKRRASQAVRASIASAID